MKNRKRVLIIITSALILSALVYAAVRFLSGPAEIPPFDPAFSAYIEAYTSGSISKESSITVKLAYEVPEEIRERQDAGNLFEFSPSIPGKAVYTDGYTVVFVPDQPMESGRIYTVDFALGKLLEVESSLKTFAFGFEVITQAMDVIPSGMKATDSRNLKLQELRGQVQTADVEVLENVSKTLNATQQGRKLPIRWENGSRRNTFGFIVDSIRRGEEASSVELAWDGKAMGADSRGRLTVRVPALGEFILTGHKVYSEPEQYILLQFSDPLPGDQNLDGLITLQDVSPLRFAVSEQEIRVYAPRRLTGEMELFVSSGLRNSAGYKLKEDIRMLVGFEQLTPALRRVSAGVIIPAAEKLAYPFEAVNLKAVDVKVIRIFENNLKQFFQVNALDGNYELKRVGKVVAQKTIPLDTDKLTDLHQWNRFSIDLDPLIRMEPGAIYQITLGFRQDYSVYPCEGQAPATAEEEEEFYDYEYTPDEFDTWFYPRGYRWEYRDNPCHVSYYTSERWIRQNVLASDLGLLAKQGSRGEILVAVNHLLTTHPEKDVEIEVYDYPQQLLARGKTGSDGLAKIQVKGEPYLLIARKGKQKGYLRLDNGSSLSLSRFDVGGEAVQEGLKGFLYGERGVWRPGDTLHLMFVLQDRQKNLPPEHPVTLELTGPQGQSMRKLVAKSGTGGIYSFRTTTSADAPTGNWTATIKAGGATFTKNLRIETIQPNRLKIELETGKSIYAKSPAQITLSANWLHGAPARNLNARVEAVLRPGKTIFPKFESFIFDDPVRKSETESRSLFDGQINEEGRARFEASFSAGLAPGMMEAIFTTRVFEPGGGFSIDRKEVPYYPYSTYLGIRAPEPDPSKGFLLTNEDYVFNLVALSDKGTLLTGETIVHAEVYKMEWRWWWDRSEEYLGNYNVSGYHKPLIKKDIRLVNGKGTFPFRLDYPAWGRYLVRIIDPEGGHATGTQIYVDWGSEYARMPREKFDGVNLLSFSTDKELYHPGDEAVLTLPSAAGGRLFLSIESGSGVLHSQWVETQKDQTRCTFRITEDMTPNVYAHVTLLQPHSQTLNDLPVRMYGVVPVRVEDPATHLQPVISIKNELRPGEKASVTVSEKSGRAMAYTLAIVDEGLLDLTRYKTPDPWSAFFAREALGVRTWDLYDQVLGAWSMRLDRLLSIGGDEYDRPKEDGKARRFKPMVISIGPSEIAKGKSRTHHFTVPQYVGSVRVMAVAVSDGAYGSSEKTVKVKKPLMLLATLPRVLSPGETLNLPVNVFVMSDKIKSAEVTVDAGKMLSVEGNRTETLRFEKEGDQMVFFRLRASARPGVARIRVSARSGNETAVYEAEIDIRNPNPMITSIRDTVIGAGKSVSLRYDGIGVPGTGMAHAEFSGILPLNLGKRLDYLIRYPYGCLEQTTSAAFPQLFLAEVADLDAESKQKTETHIREAIQKITRLQTSAGGIGYWPGATHPEEWSTTYAGHFMIEAKNKGYSIPGNFIERWKRYQRTTAGLWVFHPAEGNDLMQAYRLYSLALAGAPELGFMNRLREQSGLSDQARWCLASAYVLAGQPEVAKGLTSKASRVIKSRATYDPTYGSPLRDQAMILEALVLTGNRNLAAQAARDISKELTGTGWHSTQSTAWALVSLSRYIAGAGRSSEMNLVCKAAGKKWEIRTLSPCRQLELPRDLASGTAVEVRNNGKSDIYLQLVMKGQPATGEIYPPSSEGLEMNIRFLTPEGQPLEVSSLEQGTDFLAAIRVKHPGIRPDYHNLALSIVFPSGWEIHNQRLFGGEGKLQSSPFVYQDIRDDRVDFFFDLKKNQEVIYYVLLNASYTGRYFMPPAACEAMYDAGVYARSSSQWVEVSP